MTLKERLSNIKAIKLEIKDIQNRIDHLPMAKDVVRGSLPEFPYTAVNISITGVDEDAAAKLRCKLERKCRQLQDEIAELETIMDGIGNSEMRLILRLLYVDGLSQEQIARELGYSRSAIAVKLHRFFKTAQL